ncbi:ABC transporter [Drepanopeziza brunnea f. sp. 'multigermtubi' MB_m1]|uniref:ABC transporter n=1 Tax=Marssonina brunnea f. sp. multigermtubi (strain MB_m1) TaxID=1072389 RepID=K1WL85_MARBU|nr:ABC transporter [Drepanopeziza brunnea f. sp. 'multigermtubi' MB_m1]EKD13596.1 ABC transporter [Drepanopeziza brunnea f. sp. 'multigermtubi' MB_m1]
MGKIMSEYGIKSQWLTTPGSQSPASGSQSPASPRPDQRLLPESEAKTPITPGNGPSPSHDEEANSQEGEKKAPPPPRIFSYSTRNDRIILAVATAASIATGVTLPLMNICFARLVGAFGGLHREIKESPERFTHEISYVVMDLVYLFFARLVLSYVAMFGFRIVSLRVSAAMRLAYIEALFAQPISVLDVLPSGQTAAIITVTANILQVGISEKLSMLIQTVSLMLAALVIAARYNWLLTLVTSTGLIFITFVYGYTIPRYVRNIKEVGSADRVLSRIASETFGSIRTIAAYGAEEQMATKYAEWVNISNARGLRISPLIALQQAPTFFAIQATCALAFWYAVKLYRDSYITSVTTIIVVLMSVMLIMTTLGSTAAPASAAMHAASAASILFTIIDAPQPKTSGSREPEVSSQDIVFENVNFTYPMRADVKILDNLSVRFPAGKTTAIVGASGSGKSTIIGLVERWYELDGNMTDNIMTMYFRNGTIKTGGRHLHEIDLKWWRSQIGLVQQEPFLFNDTIYKNVEYGLVGSMWEYDSHQKKMELVKQACEEAFADEFITRLPQGYNTPVGDAGIKLSGGQRQRIAIARSIVKQPKILIFDEATSAIDVKGEKIVQAALDKVSRNRTTITIAHRLSTIMRADNIVVLKKGQVVQQGTHDELLEDTTGPYWHLANAQKLSLGNEQVTLEEEVGDAAKTTDAAMFHMVSLDNDNRFVTVDKAYVPRGFFGSFVGLLWEQKKHLKLYVAILLGALGAGAALPIQSYLFAHLLSIFNLTGERLSEETRWWCLMLTALAVFAGLSFFILGWSANTVSFHITSAYRKEYFGNVLQKPISFYDQEENSIGSLTSRMASDPTQLQQLLGINMAFVYVSMFNLVGCLGLSFYFGIELAGLAVASSMPIILAAGYFRFRYEIQFEEMNYSVFAESSKFATESIGAFRTVSSLTLEDEISGRYKNLLQTHIRKALRKAAPSSFVFALCESVPLLCMAFVLWYGGKLLAKFEYEPFNYHIAQASAAANRICGMRPGMIFKPKGKTLEFAIRSEKDGASEVRGVKLELRDVWFRYPTRDVPVLQGLDMTIEAGQFAAIVGPSGSGKTSIISLLERFYEPDRGSILLRNTDITKLSLSSYRAAFSLVAQEASLFSGSIRSNVLLGVDPQRTPDEALHRACQQADIHDFITSLPDGYATEVGTRGIALSGGQKQRLAIARALIRDPRVLLLDEATSNLDSVTEREVQGVLERTGRGRTMVVVAHRLATVQNADVIFVVEGGKVVEKGNHAQLLKRRGVYWQMTRP